MAKRIVLFGATGSQGGSIATELLKLGNAYTVVAITRNVESDAAKSLEKAGAQLVVADMYEPKSLETAVSGAYAIFAVTDFIGAGSIDKEMLQGTNIVDAARSTLDTLEVFIWSNLPDARNQKAPFQNVIHFNSKNNIAKYLRSTPLAAVTTEVILGPYYQNLIKAPPVYGPQKLSDGFWQLMLPVHANTKIPFTSVDDLGKVIQVILEEPKKFYAKKISCVCQNMTPADILQPWNTAVGLKATFKELSTEDYNQRLLKVHQFPEHLALALAENLSVYRDNPEAWVEGTDYSIRNLVPNVKTWEQYVQEEDWSVFFKSVGAVS